MKKRLLMVSALATALSLPTGFASADNTDQTPAQKNTQVHDRQHISDKQPVTQPERPAKTDQEQEQAPVILQMKIIKVAD